VTDRLPGLVPWKVGPNSIQSGSVGGFTVAKRMPSGRLGDSILITSAPSVASWWVHAGPAQNAVRSSTVTPASGNGSAAAADEVDRSVDRSVDSGAGVVVTRKGDRGARNPSACSTNTPRSTKWSIDSTSRPLPTCATGTRNSSPSSQISATVCVASHGRTTDSANARLRPRPPIELRRSSAERSTRPIIAAKSDHCWGVNTHRPIQPSLHGTTWGQSPLRDMNDTEPVNCR
jgi:hypothetical protein